MRRTFLTLLGAAAAAAAATAGAARSADAQAGVITGRVTDAATQLPLRSARVRAVPAGGGGAADSTLADDRGVYRVVNVAPGRYVVTAQMIGYARAADTVAVENGATATADFALRASANVLDQVVVTASRRAERAQEAPASVSVVGPTEIQSRPAPSAAEHLRTTPGVDIAQTGVMNTSVVVRGFNAAFSSSLQMLTDYRIAAVPGLQVNRFGSIAFANEDIERMEVVLGPAAALYGPNTANGVVHVLTRSPLAYTGSVVTVAGGERGAFLGTFRTAHKLGENFGVKVAGSYFRAEEWPFTDTAEVRLKGVAATQLAAFRSAQAGLGRTEQQIEDSIRRNPDLYALTRIGVRRDDARRYGVDVRADWRPTPGLTTVLQLGQVSNTSTDLTGISASAQDDFRTTYYQVRASAGRFFAQVYLEEGDAGGTYTTRTGAPVVDDSRLWVTQLQHGLSLFGGRQDFTYGADLLHTIPNSGGTVYGRNEEDDNVTQTGAYLQSESRLTNWLRLVLAGRVDYHSVLENSIFSPRAGIVVEPTRDHSFRFTYNRAFQAPTAINLFLDRLSSRSGPYAIQAVAPGVSGWDFRLDNGSVAIRSPFNPAATGGANTRVAYNQQAVSRYAINYLAATGQITPTEAGRLLAANPNFTVIGRNPQTGRAAAFDPNSVRNVGGIDNEVSEVFEVGYKGIVGRRFQFGVDLWRLNRKNFISQLYAPAPLLLVRGQDVAAFLIANGIAATRAATLATNAASTPMGVVAAAEMDAYTSGVPILITYKNYANIDLNGADLSAQALLGRAWRLRAAASFVSDNYFSFGPDEQPVALNAPKEKASLALGYEGERFNGEARVRYSGEFPVYSGVYVGNKCVEPAGSGVGDCVEAATVADLTLGYRLPRVTGTSVLLSVSNVFDTGYRSFVGVPEVGRLTLLQLRQEF